MTTAAAATTAIAIGLSAAATAAMIMAIMVTMIVMMAVCAVYMAVLDFFGAGIAYINHVYIVKQGGTGQRRVAVNCDFVTIDVGYGNGNKLAFVGLRMELHADYHVIAVFEHVAVNYLCQRWIVFTVGVSGLYGHFKLIAQFTAIKGFFQAGDDVIGAV